MMLLNPHLEPLGAREIKECFEWFDCACCASLLSITMKSPNGGSVRALLSE